MVWGPSKKVVVTNEEEWARRRALDDELIEKLSKMENAVVRENYLAQNNFARSENGIVTVLTYSRGRVFVEDILRDAESLADYHRHAEKNEASRAQFKRERAEAAEEAERDTARQAARDLRQRLRGELGLGADDSQAETPRAAEHNVAPPSATETWRKAPAKSVPVPDAQWESDQFHVDPQTGVAQLCTFSVPGCPFATPDFHFDSSDHAHHAWQRKQLFFDEWVSRSSIPQEPGWAVQHVFDPERPETSAGRQVWLDDRRHLAPAGTRLVFENGWVLEVLAGPDTSSRRALVDGEEANGVKRGARLRISEVFFELDQFGGRLEFRDGIKPMRLPWGLTEEERPNLGSVVSTSSAASPNSKPWWKRKS
jgi:hypothetical protein